MNKTTLYAFTLSFLLLITVILLNRYTFQQMQTYTMQVDHTREVITAFERLSSHFKSAQIYSKSYDTSTGKSFYKLYKHDAESVPRELSQLKYLVKDNAGQARLVDSLYNLIHGQLSTLLDKNIAELVESEETWRLDYLVLINEIIERGISSEDLLLATRKGELKESTTMTNLLTTAFAVIAIGVIVFYFMNNFFNVRKRRWLEGFLESVLNTSQNGIINYKAVRSGGKIDDFKVEFVNKSIENLFGIRPEHMLGKQLKNNPVFKNSQELFDTYVSVVESGQSTIFEILEDGQARHKWFLVSLEKMEDGLTASFQDITQLKKFEEELKDNILQLERSNNELEQYAYVASHDLQEPLRKIRSFGSYLLETQKQKLDERGKEHLNKIMASAERMSLLISDILSFSSIRKEEKYVPTDLNAVFNAVLADFDLSLTQKNASVDKAVLPVIDAIPLQMNQLFYNLLNNSFKFARREDRLSIRVTSKEVTEEEKKKLQLNSAARYYQIVFSDNGIGFSQEYAAQIFGLFKRLNDRQHYPGSGIGLALCKKVVDNHNGLIYAEGVENGGASFFIYLPEKQAHL